MFTLVILDNDNATVWYHRDSKIVHHFFKHYLHGPPFREVLETGAGVLEKEHAKKWLSDDRNGGPLSPSDEVWAKEIWFPRVKRAGWKHWAIVQPEKVVGQLNIKRFRATYAEQGINAQLFVSLEEAQKWLLGQ